VVQKHKLNDAISWLERPEMARLCGLSVGVAY